MRPLDEFGAVITTAGDQALALLQRGRTHGRRRNTRPRTPTKRRTRAAAVGDKGKGKTVQPNPRLRFGDAADKWLAEQVSTLRPTTEASYRNSVEVHLRPRWGRRRMDSIDVDDAARLVRELREAGKSEWTISTILRAASRVFTFARRRCSWHGDNPFSLLESGERPKVAQTQRRRIFTADELAQTVARAQGPWRLLFMLAAVTGARLSELLGLVWEDLDLTEPDATISFAFQADRRGQRVPLKTEESRRTVEIPPTCRATAEAPARLAVLNRQRVRLCHEDRSCTRAAQCSEGIAAGHEGRDGCEGTANLCCAATY